MTLIQKHCRLLCIGHVEQGGQIARRFSLESCYQPNNVKNHASCAFNSYYQKEGNSPGSCDFKGVAMITTTDPKIWEFYEKRRFLHCLSGHGSCKVTRPEVIRGARQ